MNKEKWDLDLFEQENKIELIEDGIKRIQTHKNQLKNEHIANIHKIKADHHREMKELGSEYNKEREKTFKHIDQHQVVIDEHKLNSLRKEELIEKEEHLRKKLKFEKNYIEAERLKFCEEKLTQEKELGEHMKENYTLDANINKIKGDMRTESRKYHNTFIKKQNGLTEIIGNLEKLESKKRLLNLDMHIYDLEEEFVGKMLSAENNKTQKNTNALREIQSQINEKQISFNKVKDKLKGELVDFNEGNEMQLANLVSKKQAVLKDLCNAEFMARCIWLQRQRLFEFFVHAGKHYENSIKCEKANLESRTLEYEEEKDRKEKLAGLEEEYGYYKYFKEKIRL